MNIYFAYLIEDINGVPLYVGKGKNSRPHDHFRDSSNTYISRKLRKLGGLKNTRIIKLEENLSSAAAYAAEMKYIAIYGRKDNGTGVLYNLSDGGEGSKGHVMSHEAKKRLSIMNLGYKHSNESKLKMSLFRKGRKHNHGDKIRLARLGSKLAPSTRLKISERAKSRFQQMSSAEILERMQPMLIASKTPSAISKMSNSLRITLAKPEVKAKRSAANSLGNNPRAKCCIVRDIQFTSVTEAAIALNVSRSKIRDDPSFRYL